MEEGQISRNSEGKNEAKWLRTELTLYKEHIAFFPVIVKYFQVKKEEEKVAL